MRDQAIGILATSPIGVHHALLFLHTTPDPSDDQWEQLAARQETLTGSSS